LAVSENASKSAVGLLDPHSFAVGLGVLVEEAVVVVAVLEGEAAFKAPSCSEIPFKGRLI